VGNTTLHFIWGQRKCGTIGAVTVVGNCKCGEAEVEDSAAIACSFAALNYTCLLKCKHTDLADDATLLQEVGVCGLVYSKTLDRYLLYVSCIISAFAV
jgi:hypothetical protein